MLGNPVASIKFSGLLAESNREVGTMIRNESSCQCPRKCHHGGAWKVAYPDLVTAMMALFIVLWLMNSSKQLQEAVDGYFKDPTGSSRKVGTDMQGSGENFFVRKQDMAKIKELQAKIRKITDFDKLSKQIEMTITAEGLRIELLEGRTVRSSIWATRSIARAAKSC